VSTHQTAFMREENLIVAHPHSSGFHQQEGLRFVPQHHLIADCVHAEFDNFHMISRVCRNLEPILLAMVTAH
jgi:hypothetical protein